MKVVKKIIAAVLVVAAALFIIANVTAGLATIHDVVNGYQSRAYNSSYYWAMNDGRYVRLLNMRLEDEANGFEVEEDYAVCQAAADYYYAAVMYKAYLHTGDKESAAAQKAKMEAAKEAMAGEAAVAEDIDAMLADH